MTLPRLPRYFVAHSSSADAVDIGGELSSLHVVDTFFVSSRHFKEHEYIVVVDQFGNLRALPGENHQQLSEMLQNEIAFNEIPRNKQARLIEANNVFLFNLIFSLSNKSAAFPDGTISFIFTELFQKPFR